MAHPIRSRTGNAELERARNLLSEARNELDPRQWELLDNKLTEAEQAWEHFNTVAQASGKAAEVAKEAEALSEAGRASEPGEGIETLPKAAGAALALLTLLWPSSTAGPEYDEIRPPWLQARFEYESKLKEVANAAKQVKAEIKAARREAGGKRKVYKKEGDPAPDYVPDNWVYPPGKRPCNVKGTGGPGLSKGGRFDWVRCTYDCGGREKEKEFWGNSDAVCRDPRNRFVY